MKCRHTCEYVYLVTIIYPPVWLLWPWPWPWRTDLHTQTWPSYSEDVHVHSYQKWSLYITALKTWQTHRRDRMRGLLQLQLCVANIQCVCVI